MIFGSCEEWRQAMTQKQSRAKEDPPAEPSLERSIKPIDVGGWICPRCGGGNAIWSARCPCVPIPLPPVTCDTNSGPATPLPSYHCPICKQHTLWGLHDCKGSIS